MKYCLSPIVVFFLSVSVAHCTEWKKEFEDICAKVEIAESLSLQELEDLIKRSEKLLKTLQTLQTRAKKVYIFRLKKCKAFFEYIYELKKNAEKTK